MMDGEESFKLENLKEQVKIVKEDYLISLSHREYLENKCNRYLIFFTLLNAVIFAICAYLVENLFINFFLCSSILILIIAMLFACISLQFKVYSYMDYNMEIKDKMDNYNDPEKFYNYLITEYLDSIQINDKLNKEKTKNLKISYKLSIVAICLLGFSMILETGLILGNILLTFE